MGKQRKELRDEMRLVIANLDDRWLRAASLEVCEQLNAYFNEIDKPINHILAFQPLISGYVDLTTFIRYQLAKERRVYIPCEPKESIAFFEIKPELFVGEDLSSIKQVSCEAIVDTPYSKDDALYTAVIMPGLAYDKHGNRIGWGNLSYEQLISKAGLGKALKVGVCWEMQFLSDMPSTSTDILMDWVCHERGFFRTGLIAHE